MKKKYCRPMLVCEELHPETFLCACDYPNYSMNEEWHCSFDPHELGFFLFVQSWDSCLTKEGQIGDLELCVHTVEVHVFSAS